MKEEFRRITGFSNYIFGSFGTIINESTGAKVGWINKDNGYVYVSIVLSKGKYLAIRAHKLIALAFLGECPDGMQVAHIDGVKIHNSASNLKYCTPKENTLDKKRHGTMLCCEDHPQAKISNKDAMDIKMSNEVSRSLAKKYGVCPQTIQRIKNGSKWKELGAEQKS